MRPLLVKAVLLGISVVALAASVIWRPSSPSTQAPAISGPLAASPEDISTPSAANQNALNVNLDAANSNTAVAEPTAPPTVVSPLTGFSDRVTKKGFGLHITRTNSPVQPERFTGYHTAADAEVTEAEQQTDVPVYAIADGVMLVRQTANGYGGLVLVVHDVDGQTVTAVYGHLRLTSVSKQVGQAVVVGERLGLLGTGGTPETDGERKHLHFGLRPGRSTNSRGYVSTAAELSAWLDPVTWLVEHEAAEPG